MLENINKYKVLLASNSPRRQELLREMGVDFEVVAKQGIDESYPADMKAKDVPEFLALKKAAAYADIITDDTLLITADTVVILDKEILGKPHSAEEARQMLRRLQNTKHNVISGVALTTATKQVSFSVKTKVTFHALTDEMIAYYVDKYQPLDKAGAYGIQEWIGLIGIDHIEGSYHNVMGLPTQRLFKELVEL